MLIPIQISYNMNSIFQMQKGVYVETTYSVKRMKIIDFIELLLIRLFDVILGSDMRLQYDNLRPDLYKV